MVVLTLLLMQVAHRLIDRPDDPEPSPAQAEADNPDAVALAISAIEPVRIKVERDGAVAFEGVLCTGAPPDCPEPTLRFAPASEIAVELADLTRARVIYNGTRVEPLGNLSAPRRLVFIDDVGH